MKVISGGQTGADRTFLEVAKELGFETGGWVPLGCRTDAGDDRSLLDFGCVETKDRGYPNRTRMNVRQSDGTVIFGDDSSPGCVLTKNLCTEYGKPCIVNPSAEKLVKWIRRHRIEVLNGAGNRARTNPFIGDIVRRSLVPALLTIRAQSPVMH